MAVLVNGGADVSARSNSGVTPLHLAAECPHNQEILPLLLDHGAHIDALDEQRRTPLHWAARVCWPDDGGLVLLLLRGADASLRDATGSTPADLVGADECRAEIERWLRAAANRR